MLKHEAIELLIGNLILKPDAWICSSAISKISIWDYINLNIESALIFYPHEKIFHVMRSLRARGKPLDILLVAEEHGEIGINDEIGRMVKAVSGKESIIDLVNIILDEPYHESARAEMLRRRCWG